MLSVVEAECEVSTLVAGNMLKLGGRIVEDATAVSVLTEYVSVRLP